MYGGAGGCVRGCRGGGRGHAGAPAGVNWWVCGRLLPHGARSRPGGRDGLAVVYPRSRDAGGPVQAAGGRETPGSSIHHQYIFLGRLVQIYISVRPHHVFRYISPPHRPNPPGASQGAWIAPHATPLSSPPHPRPDEAAMPPGSPRGLPPPLRANWSTRLLRDAQHPIADWSIPPAMLHLPPPPVCWLRSPPPAPRPPPRPPSQLAHPPPPAGAPPEGEPLLAPPCNPRAAWRGLSPRGEALDHPRAGRRSAQQAPRHAMPPVEPLP
jgi:hypothetical protein